MIELEQVSKIYSTGKGEVRALDSLSLAIDRGEFVAVRGPSGCGKSTLLALAGGLALPTSGSVVVGGERISSMSAAQRAAYRARAIGFVFQMFHLLPYLNVLQNVLVSAPQADSQSKHKAAALLERFGLEGRLNHRPGQLSAGERQRTAMARALLNDPPLLLADEPTGNLDPENASGVLDLLSEFHASGGTVLLVTHDERAAARAGRSIELCAGRLARREPHAATP